MTKHATATCDLATLKNLTEELAAKKRAVKDAEELADWEQKTSARNPAFVPGSVRSPSIEEISVLGHTHGKVCTIRCQACGETRTINKQDAFQVRYCKDCRKEANRETSKEKRLVKKLDGTSREELERQIAELTTPVTYGRFTNYRDFRGYFLLVSLVTPDDLEVDEVLADKPTMDSILREMKFMSNKRDRDSLTILGWDTHNKVYKPVSHIRPE